MNLCSRSVFWLVALIALSGTALAKETIYKIGVGDVLEVKVFGEPEFSGTFRIGSDGTFEYPFLRKITGDGKTTEDVVTELTKRLRDGYLTDPQVSVEVRDFRSQNVLVLGAVVRPGTYSLQEETRILDLVSKAGGLLPGGGKKIVLLRGKGKTTALGPKLEVPAADIPKLEGPKVEIPKGEAGNVGAPTAQSSSEEKVLPLPSSSPTPPTIEKVIASVDISETKPILIDYYKLVHDGDFSQNLLIQDGDIINVPKANEIFVLGNVAKPGPVPYEENMTILQAVTLAGGPTAIASPKSTYILRQGPSGEEKIGVRLDKVLINKAKNQQLKPDDVIVIPESFF